MLRGTLKPDEKQAIIHMVSHESRIDVAQACQAGDKSSEITVMREFMEETGLDKAKMSLDAHHCNSETMTQIEQAGGQTSLAETIDHEVSRCLVCTREAHLHPLDLSNIDSRWKKSGLRALVMMNRETFNKATQETTSDTSYYLSHYENAHQQYTVDHLAKTIRGHWVVESKNWQLDVTFGEDSVKTKEGCQALIMGKLRCFSMNLIRWSGKRIKNFQATIEKFTDSPQTLISMLRQVNFL